MEKGVGDDGVRHAVPLVDAVQPSGLVHRVSAVVLGLDVHRGDDVQAVRVEAVVLGKVASLEGGVVAEQEVGLGMVAEPGVMVIQVPQVVMGVDDLELFESQHEQILEINRWTQDG
jgi:hypothetical protein